MENNEKESPRFGPFKEPKEIKKVDKLKIIIICLGERSL
jgi:hypothetical protein